MYAGGEPMRQNAKEYQGKCIFCGQLISTKQVGVGYTKTKRKTVILFHEACFMGCTVKGGNNIDTRIGTTT